MFHPARLLALACSLSLLVTASAHADDNASMPRTLVIGYEEEGKVDPSAASCREFVNETIEWEKAEMEQAIKDVCAHRREHVDAYEALQTAYSAFRAVLQEQIRFDGPEAARSIAAIVKNCIDFKWALSTGGHNIGMDMMPNVIAASCLEMGRELLEDQTSALGPRPDEPVGGE